MRPYKRHWRLQLRYGQGGRKIQRRYASDNSDFLKRLRKAVLNLDMIARRRATLPVISALMMVMAGRVSGGHLSTRYIGGWARAQNRAMGTGPDQQAGEHEYELALTQFR